MGLGFVKNYAGFIAVRAVLGLTEGGLLPGIVSYQTPFSLDFCLILYTDLVSVPHVPKGRNSLQNWALLHQCFVIRRIWG